MLLGCFFHLPVFHRDTKCSASCSIEEKKGIHELAVIISALPSLADVEQHQTATRKRRRRERGRGSEREKGRVLKVMILQLEYRTYPLAERDNLLVV